MKKIRLLLILSLVFFCNSYSFANYDTYKTFINAVMAQKSGNIELAKEEYEKVIKDDLNAIFAFKELTNLYWLKGETDKALYLANKLKMIDGDNVKTNLFLGSFYLIANKLDLAKQAWEDVLKIEPNNEMATVSLATYNYSNNKLKESVKYWNKFLEQQPESAEAYFQLALVQERLGMLDKALDSLSKVLELKPEATETFLVRGRIYETQKKLDLAILEYEKYVGAFPKNTSVSLYLANCYFKQQNYKKTQEVLLKAKKNAPKNIQIQYFLGINYEKQLEIHKAIDCFEEIVKTDASHANFARLGYYYALIKKFDKAEKYFNKAIALDSLNSEYYYLLALDFIDAKKYEQAKDTLQKTLAINPDNNNAKFYLALANDELNNFDEAEKLLKEILVLEPNNLKVLNYLGYSYVKKDIKLDDAQQLITKAISLSPRDPALIDSLAWLCYKKHQYKEAEQYMLIAINLKPQIFDKVLYEHLGEISISLNKFPQAWLSYAIAKDIGSTIANDKMKELESKCSADEINKMYGERAIHNYIRFLALKCDYKLRIKYLSTKFNSLVNILSAQQFGMELSFVQVLTVPSFSVLLFNNQIKFSSNSVANMIDDTLFDTLEFSKFIFSKEFIKYMYNVVPVEKSKQLIYNKDDICVIVDKKSGKIIEVEKKDVVNIKIKDYKILNDYLSIPDTIVIQSKKVNFTCQAKFNKLFNVSLEELKNKQQNWNKYEVFSTSKN